MTERYGTTSEPDDELSALLSDHAVWADLPEGLEERVVDAVLAERDRWGAEPEVLPSPGRRRPPLWVPVAAAVAVLAALGIALFATGDGGGVPGERVALSGTDLVPDASGVAIVETTPDGVRIVLDTDDLGPAPEGSYYEAWVRTGPDVGVSAGTFHLRGDGQRIVLWAGVPVEDYPIFTVTLQDEGAGPQSSGRVVLRGRIGS